MSYDIELVDPITKECLLLDEPHQMKGGTYAVGGCQTAELNVTWNYGRFYHQVFGKQGYNDGIRSLYGMSGAESIPVLKKAIELLGDDVSDNYWDTTEGNAKRALIQLLALAQMRPDGLWSGD